MTGAAWPSRSGCLGCLGCRRFGRPRVNYSPRPDWVSSGWSPSWAGAGILGGDRRSPPAEALEFPAVRPAPGHHPAPDRHRLVSSAHPKAARSRQLAGLAETDRTRRCDPAGRPRRAERCSEVAEDRAPPDSQPRSVGASRRTDAGRVYRVDVQVVTALLARYSCLDMHAPRVRKNHHP